MRSGNTLFLLHKNAAAAGASGERMKWAVSVKFNPFSTNAFHSL
jgi:hypothetical protein